MARPIPVWLKQLGLASQPSQLGPKKYQEIGLLCLQDKPRSGRPLEFDGTQRAKITALACSQPPAGYGQWSLRLLADKAVELEYCDSISHTEVANILKKTS